MTDQIAISLLQWSSLLIRRGLSTIPNIHSRFLIIIPVQRHHQIMDVWKPRRSPSLTPIWSSDQEGRVDSSVYAWIHYFKFTMSSCCGLLDRFPSGSILLFRIRFFSSALCSASLFRSSLALLSISAFSCCLRWWVIFRGAPCDQETVRLKDYSATMYYKILLPRPPFLNFLVSACFSVIVNKTSLPADTITISSISKRSTGPQHFDLQQNQPRA